MRMTLAQSGTVMNRTLRDKIARAIAKAEEASQSPDAYGFLPVIIESLKAMLAGSTMNERERERMAGGLGRLVTEDFNFSESQLGSLLLDLADQFGADQGSKVSQKHKKLTDPRDLERFIQASEEYFKNGTCSLDCDKCGHRIEFRELSPTAWEHNCRCGKFNGTIRGL